MLISLTQQAQRGQLIVAIAAMMFSMQHASAAETLQWSRPGVGAQRGASHEKSQEENGNSSRMQHRAVAQQIARQARLRKPHRGESEVQRAFDDVEWVEPARRRQEVGERVDRAIARFQEEDTADDRSLYVPTSYMDVPEEPQRRYQEGVNDDVVPAYVAQDPQEGAWEEYEQAGYVEGVGYCCDDTGCAAPTHCGSPMCCDTCGDVGCGGTCGHGYHDDVCEVFSLSVPRIRELMLHAGVHGFKGPLDRNRDSGNFGFHEGVNFSGRFPFGWWPGVNYQVGYQGVHSQLHGSEDSNITDSHTQHFLTTGLFHRPHCGHGYQYGVVWDMLRDDRDQAVTFNQLRTEIGFVNQRGKEFGFLAAISLNSEVIQAEEFQSADQFLFYYRVRGRQGGAARLYGGFTSSDEGVLGGEALIPLTDAWSLQSGFAYLIPNNNGTAIDADGEAWNLGLSLVWHWGGRARACHKSPYMPMFAVANNGSMIISR